MCICCTCTCKSYPVIDDDLQIIYDFVITVLNGLVILLVIVLVLICPRVLWLGTLLFCQFILFVSSSNDCQLLIVYGIVH